MAAHSSSACSFLSLIQPVPLLLQRVISGFNTDIEHDGVVYHVQTEDKGLAKAELMTLVYNRGTILASKRTSYSDLAQGDLNKEELSERLTRQHKLICAAVKAGRIAELGRMSKTSAIPAKAAKPATKHEPEPIPPTAVAEPAAQPPSPPPTPVQPPAAASPSPRAASPPPRVEPKEPPPIAKPAPADLIHLEPVFEAADIVEVEEVILEADAVAVLDEPVRRERPSHEKLTIELFGEKKYKSGDRCSISMMVSRGSSRRVIPGAQIMVKALGAAFRPVIFHAKSDANGLAKIHFQIPTFKSGRAALLIRAMSDGEEVELRRLIAPG